MARHTIVRIYTDGGARGNPGPAAIGIVVSDRDDKVIKEFGEYIGRATNNQAEYRALVRGLEIAANYTDSEVVCISDSELVVRQMTGEYRIKNEEMRSLAEIVKEKSRSFRKVRYLNQPRMTGHLARADGLVNETLDGLRRPRQPPVNPGITKEAEVGVSREPSGEKGEGLGTHGPLREGARAREQVDPSAIGAAFLEFCVMRGWLVREGKGRSARYCVTEEGMRELRAFGIDLSR